MNPCDLTNLSDDEISARIAKAELVHPQEACRVGMYLGALKEVRRLRESRRILATALDQGNAIDAD